MKQNCKYFRWRTKNYKKYPFCTVLKIILDTNECSECSYTEYVLKPLKKAKKPIKKVSKKRVFVSEKTYNLVFNESKGRCALCGTTETLQYHHIKYRSERKDLIDDHTNGIMLCNKCHNLVHSNKKKYQPLLLEIKQQKKDEDLTSP